MKISPATVVFCLLMICSTHGALITFGDRIQALYDNVNRARADPSSLSWASGRNPAGPLHWSWGLSMAARNIAKFNGAQGGNCDHVSMDGGKDLVHRVDEGATYTAGSLVEATICHELPADADDKEETMHHYLDTSFSQDADSAAKSAFFDTSITHVGIHCGCHKNTGKLTICSFIFGKGVVDKPGVKHLDMIEVPNASCQNMDT